tara:strand:- start:79 stop:1272 length:1194 start_codon:yes stop_codon:yes gene_type:complete
MKIKLLLVLTIALTVYSCSKDNDEGVSSFNFQVEIQNVTDRSASISWNHPLNENVTYSVYLNDEVVEESFKTTAYTFTKLDPEIVYNGKIIATNGSQTATANFSFETEIYKPIIFEKNAYLTNQQAVNEFGSHHYNEIRYNLSISGTDVYDLSPLNDLKKVHGEIKIEGVSSQKLDGLENLEFIGDRLYLYNNHYLKNLNALQNLTQINGNIELFSNPELKDINGLQNLSGFNGGLQVEGCKVQNIDILQNATRLKNLYIGFNPELQAINGLGNVTQIDEFLDIVFNEKLSNLDGLNAISSVGDYVYIGDLNSPVLGLKSLTSVSNRLTILFNPMLKNLDELKNLRNFGDLTIAGNNSLEDFCEITIAVVNMNKEVNIFSNPFNPRLQDFINGNCSQ